MSAIHASTRSFVELREIVDRLQAQATWSEDQRQQLVRVVYRLGMVAHERGEALLTLQNTQRVIGDAMKAIAAHEEQARERGWLR